MTGTFSVSDSVELAVVERSGFIESRHAGSAVVLSPEGEVLRALGDARTPIFPRSCLKPFQAVAVMTSGVTLRGEDAAIATASHSGTAAHVALVRGLLARESLPTSALGCPPAAPTDQVARDELDPHGGPRERVYMNCSGKHAAMLLACVANELAARGLPRPRASAAEAHPRRARALHRRAPGGHGGRRMRRARARHQPARARPAASRRSRRRRRRSPFALYREAAALTEAAREHAWAVGGPGQPDTVAIERLGVFAKVGAEGVMVMTAPDGTTDRAQGARRLRRARRPSSRCDCSRDVGRDRRRRAIDAVQTELDLWVMGGERRVGAVRAPTI